MQYRFMVLVLKLLVMILHRVTYSNFKDDPQWEYYTENLKYEVDKFIKDSERKS